MIPNAVCKEHDKKLGEGTALNSPKLREAQAIAKLSKALGGKLLHFYVYAAVEGEMLVFYFSHPAILMEFENQKESVIDKMRKIYKEEGMKPELLFFKKISAKVKAKAHKREVRDETEEDRATGAFEIRATDPGLAKMFRSIQRTIKEKNERHRNGG